MNGKTVDRLESEKSHYDREFGGIKLIEEEMYVDDRWLVDYHRYHNFALRKIGDIKGKKVLNVGAGGMGGGKNTVWLARQGVSVYGVDITEKGLLITKQLADYNGVKVDLRLESAEKTSFPSEHFDKILSYGVIHHLNIEEGIKELYRCLKKGGELIVVEPWDGNPLLRFARNHLWYPQKNRTVYERALNKNDIAIFVRYFSEYEITYFELFSSLIRILRLIPFEPIREVSITLCDKIDDFILNAFPFMRYYCRNFVGRFIKS